ncbi:MAG: hypothetical protein COY81_00905 [Candidatus Pacebacteria bacterium CG_4_10_14_0_8_um_filter_43_12]|nr:MAG: hypothetical protein COU66_03250 [Candidatus Pacebacteria bacterium CG10_big_fil_rev_8_21_14_0_10_44_11]PIY79783.1 MAG: hypothetical protein COY81_00905 [Candidatus Pacebacteria bacterium CG_4_10_14_0_8_um_filter_43_12]
MFKPEKKKEWGGFLVAQRVWQKATWFFPRRGLWLQVVAGLQPRAVFGLKPVVYHKGGKWGSLTNRHSLI